MGCDAEWTQAVLRISMPVAISDEHLDYFVKTLKEIV
jgi:4-aminobutyrate aminotransferase-like enzyme